jgi:hypothetical protein
MEAEMSAITIKKIPAELLDELRREAEMNRRSLNAEVIYRLAQSVSGGAGDTEAFLAQVRENRERMRVWVTDDEVRRARDDGRR